MTGGQIAALLLAILLLLPGGCFVLFGVAFLNGEGLLSEHPHVQSDPVPLQIGLGILAVAALLFWVAFRRRPRLAAVGGAPRTPLDQTIPLTAERARRELELRNYVVRRFIFGSNRHDVRLPSGETRDFPDEAAFLEWARAELSDNAEESS
jgi:hypothetical protein